MAEKRCGFPQFDHINDNLIVSLLDKRSRIIWTSDNSSKTSPFVGVEAFRLIPEDQRGTYEDAISRTIVFGKPSQLVLRDMPPPHSMQQLSDVTYRTTTLPVDLPSVAACAISSILPRNYDEFDEDDKQVLRLLASDCTLKEIAAKLHRSESTIDARVKSLKEKLKRKNIGGLVAAALMYRII